MIRRALIATVALLAAVTASGCAALPIGSSGEAADAASILQRADEASKNIDSLSFFMTMKGDVASQNFTILVHGGAYVKGDQAGDIAMRMTMLGAGLPSGSGDMQVVVRNGVGYLELGGTWQRIPGLTLSPDQLSQSQDALGALAIVKYVKDVHVESNTLFLGEPVTKIAAKIDAKNLLKSMLGDLNDSLGQAGAGSASQFDDVLNGLGDVRVVIYVSDTTNLVRAVHEDLDMKVDGQTAHMDLDMSVVGVNEPVDVPTPAVA
jgi:hypothetical protein